MLDRLPTELLLLIFELMWSSTPDEGQRDAHFLAYSLVSRRLHRFALPFLWRSVRFDLTTAAHRAKLREIASSDDKAQLVRSLFLDMGSRIPRAESTKRNGCEVVCKFINLEELRVKGWFGRSHIQRDLLNHLSHLRSLRLADLALPLSEPLTFPNLSELFISGLFRSSWKASTAQISPLLNTATVPSLHTLAIEKSHTSRLSSWTYFPRLPNDLLSRLRVIQVYTSFYAELPSSLSNLKTPSLLKLITRLNRYDVDYLPARSASFSPYVLEINDYQTLHAVDCRIRAYTSNPFAWPLPLAIFVASYLYLATDSSTQRHIDSLQMICETHNIRLIREEETDDDDYGLVTSSQFRTFCEAFKAQRALAEEATASEASS
ncbi:hypothetical protein JCM11251_007897 [Rhodosporidiobolus azoricus]